MTPGDGYETVAELVRSIKEPHAIIGAVCEMVDHAGLSIRDAFGTFVPFPETEYILVAARLWLRDEMALGAVCGETNSRIHRRRSERGKYAERAQYNAASQLARMFEGLSRGQLNLTDRAIWAAADCRRAVVRAVQNEGYRKAERAWQIDYLQSLLQSRLSSIPEGRLRNSTLAERV